MLSIVCAPNCCPLMTVSIRLSSLGQSYGGLYGTLQSVLFAIHALKIIYHLAIVYLGFEQVRN